MMLHSGTDMNMAFDGRIVALLFAWAGRDGVSFHGRSSGGGMLVRLEALPWWRGGWEAV